MTHRADNVVRALPELRGRVLAIDLDYWNRVDLLEIPRLGFGHLNLQVTDGICCSTCGGQGSSSAKPQV